jgi:hypothetical protein
VRFAIVKVEELSNSLPRILFAAILPASIVFAAISVPVIE